MSRSSEARAGSGPFPALNQSENKWEGGGRGGAMREVDEGENGGETYILHNDA